jgi:RNA polymerase sigma-70 factor, ECF subfamily
MTLEELYERHADFVWRTVRRLGVSEGEARDAVQDVFLIVHSNLHTFRGESSLTTWLFAISRSVARERRRSARRAPALYDEGSVDDEVDLRADVARSAEHNRELALLDGILNQLPVEQRNVFILFELEKLTGEEISSALEIPLGTVYSRLKLARDAFRSAVARVEARASFTRRRAGGT